MLQWLRNTGDLARLRQEMRRFHVDSAALPAPLLSELVAMAQRNFDNARADGMPHDLLQETFDVSWRAAAAMPLIAVAKPAIAARSIGQWLYDEILEGLVENYGNGRFYHELLTACQKWQRTPNPELDALLRNKADTPPLEVDRSIETSPSRDRDFDACYPTFDEWLKRVEIAMFLINGQRDREQIESFLKGMEPSSLRKAFTEQSDPSLFGIDLLDGLGNMRSTAAQSK